MVKITKKPMRKFLVENLLLKIILIFIILWGAASFFIFPTIVFFQWIFVSISILVVYFILSEKLAYFVLVFSVFSTSYFSYGLRSIFGFPLWIVLISILVMLFIFFWVLKKQLIPECENFLLVSMFFVIAISEIYLALSFWLINPLTKSLIIGIFSYIFVGYVSNIFPENKLDKKFFLYIYTAIVVIILLLLTVSWGH